MTEQAVWGYGICHNQTCNTERIIIISVNKTTFLILKKLNYRTHQLDNSLIKIKDKSRPVLHHCVVIFSWSSGIMECSCMLFTFENGVPIMR